MARWLPLLCLAACIRQEPPPVVAGPAHDGWRWVDRSGTHLPRSTLDTLCLDATMVDVDADGDLDVFVGNEFRKNLLLINDGAGALTDESGARIPRAEHDSEDVAVADFDGDGDVDLVIVSEDDQVNEYYLNDGRGVFEDAGDRLPVQGTSNSVAVGDIDGDGDPDLIIGNNGPNFVLLNDGAGTFVDDTANRLPAVSDVTQDLELGDLDGDGDADLVIANEDDNRLLLDAGGGVYVESSLPLPGVVEETRDVDLADIDGDGDLDVLFTNVDLSGRGGPAQNRILINDGAGGLTDAPERLPFDEDFTMDGDFVDVDGDGDLDLLTANYGDASRGRALTPYRVYVNDGAGTFAERTGDFLPFDTTGHGFDLEAGDLNGDGIPDLYLCSGRSLDRLVLSERIAAE